MEGHSYILSVGKYLAYFMFIFYPSLLSYLLLLWTSLILAS